MAFFKEMQLSDGDLLDRLFSALNAAGITANPYGWDGAYAKQIKVLPIGLRAMAATAHLDVSLTLDDLAWHFLNFGEPSHVEETEAGLRELGCDVLADLFRRAYILVQPYLPPAAGFGNELYERLELDGKSVAYREISEALNRLEPPGAGITGSHVYASWIRYARRRPELVFAG